MEDILIPIVAMLSTFGSIFGIAYIYFFTRHRERLALIEKGITAEIFRNENKKSMTYWSLKFGLLTIGIGIGLVISLPLINMGGGMEPWKNNMLIWALVLVFGGAGLLASFLIEKKLLKDSDK